MAHRPSGFGRVRLVRRIACLLALLLAALLATPATASAADPAETQSTLVAPPTPHGHQTTLIACIAIARPGETTRAMFAALAHHPCQQAYPDSQAMDDSYWMLLRPPHAGDSLQLPLLAYRPGWQSGARLSLLHADGRIATLRLDNARLAPFNRGGGFVAVPLPTGNPTPVTAVLLRVDHCWPSLNYSTGMMLLDGPAAARLAQREIRAYALFIGVCLTLLISNLLQWLFVRQTFQLTFCFNLAVLLVWAWAQGLAPIDGHLAFRLDWLTRVLRVGSWLVFWYQVLTPGAVNARLRWLTLMVGVLLQALALAQWLLPPSTERTAAVVLALTYVVFQPLALAALATAIRRDAVTLLSVALMALSPCLIYLAHVSQRLTGDIVHSDQVMLLALAGEALLSTMAMAVHAKRIIRERDTARAEELVARRLADVDPLTGLLNRRALLDRVLTRAGDVRQRLLLIDVDHFKAINDTHGHEIGDAVLRELASLLGRRTHGRCLIGRLGGEEFALIGPAGDLTAALALGIVTDVRAHHFAGRHRITVSIGTTEGTVTSEAAWSALYRRADSALYAAKGAGRNRVVDLPTDTALPDPAPPRQRVPARRGT